MLRSQYINDTITSTLHSVRFSGKSTQLPNDPNYQPVITSAHEADVRNTTSRHRQECSSVGLHAPLTVEDGRELRASLIGCVGMSTKQGPT